MALVSTFFQMFIVLGMYNFDIRENHDLCTLIGWGINLFYAATGTLLLFLTFSVFLATTSGIIGGYIGVYLSLGWGIALLMFGINVFFNLDIMGDDPRYLTIFRKANSNIHNSIAILYLIYSVVSIAETDFYICDNF